MVIRKIGIVNVQLVKDNFALVNIIILNFQLVKSNWQFVKKSKFSTYKTQLATCTFISNSKYRFTTCKIALQLVKRN